MSATTRAEDALRFLERHVHGFGPDVTRRGDGDVIAFTRAGSSRPFAVLRGNTRRVHVGFTRLGRARSKRILHARTGGLRGVRHRVVVEAPGDVDSELLAWLRESYEIAPDLETLGA